LTMGCLLSDCHRTLAENRSVFPRGDGAPLRDSGIYWLYSIPETSWIFDRLNQGLKNDGL
jgi:hypothetical protein